MKNSNRNVIGRIKYDPYKVYLPENLNIDELIAFHPLPAGIHRDQIIYILHLINSIPANTNDYDLELNKGFTAINKRTLRNRIHEYRKCLDYLKLHNIIEEGTSYLPGKYSKGLKFTPIYRTKVIPIFITKKTLIKSIVTRNHNRDLVAEEKLWFLKDNFNPNLNINMNAVTDYLESDRLITKFKHEKERDRKNYSSKTLAALPQIEELVNMGYNSKFITASNLNNRHYVKVDKTTGRFHSSLTRLKKDLRNFVKYGEQTLCSIDIINSQPLMSTILLDIDLFTKFNIHALIASYNPRFHSRFSRSLNSKVWYDSIEKINAESKYTNNPSINLAKLISETANRKDVQLFKELVREGVFYEKFALILKENGLLPFDLLDIDSNYVQEKAIRKHAKIATFTAFFCDPQKDKWIKDAQAFKKCFPNVYNIFREVKISKHNTLACVLQRFESNLMLHNICERVHELYPNVLLYTIHDSVITTIEDIEKVQETFLKVTSQWLNVVPRIQVEVWNERLI